MRSIHLAMSPPGGGIFDGGNACPLLSASLTRTDLIRMYETFRYRAQSKRDYRGIPDLLALLRHADAAATAAQARASPPRRERPDQPARRLPRRVPPTPHRTDDAVPFALERSPSLVVRLRRRGSVPLAVSVAAIGPRLLRRRGRVRLVRRRIDDTDLGLRKSQSRTLLVGPVFVTLRPDPHPGCHLAATAADPLVLRFPLPLGLGALRIGVPSTCSGGHGFPSPRRRHFLPAAEES